MQLLYSIAVKNIDFSKMKHASPEFYNLVRRLLTHDPKKRIGGGDRDADELKQHPFFKGIDWNAVEDKTLTPPFKPVIQSESDLSNID